MVYRLLSRQKPIKIIINLAVFSLGSIRDLDSDILILLLEGGTCIELIVA